MFEPMYSPWGNIQTCKILTPGVFEVTTASHGGIMVSRDNGFLLPVRISSVVKQATFKIPFLVQQRR